VGPDCHDHCQVRPGKTAVVYKGDLAVNPQAGGGLPPHMQGRPIGGTRALAKPPALGAPGVVRAPGGPLDRHGLVPLSPEEVRREERGSGRGGRVEAYQRNASSAVRPKLVGALPSGRLAGGRSPRGRCGPLDDDTAPACPPTRRGIATRHHRLTTPSSGAGHDRGRLARDFAGEADIPDTWGSVYLSTYGFDSPEARGRWRRTPRGTRRGATRRGSRRAEIAGRGGRGSISATAGPTTRIRGRQYGIGRASREQGLLSQGRGFNGLESSAELSPVWQGIHDRLLWSLLFVASSVRTWPPEPGRGIGAFRGGTETCPWTKA